MYSQLPSISAGRSSIRNLRTRHVVVTGTDLSWWQGPTYHGTLKTQPKIYQIKRYDNEDGQSVSLHNNTSEVYSSRQPQTEMWRKYVSETEWSQKQGHLKFGIGPHITNLYPQISFNTVQLILQYGPMFKSRGVIIITLVNNNLKPVTIT
jgi:hypothetical protein